MFKEKFFYIHLNHPTWLSHRCMVFNNFLKYNSKSKVIISIVYALFWSLVCIDNVRK